MTRRFARSIGGERAIASVPRNKGANVITAIIEIPQKLPEPPPPASKALKGGKSRKS